VGDPDKPLPEAGRPWERVGPFLYGVNTG
jgi:hypothetical protein